MTAQVIILKTILKFTLK